MTDGTNWVRVAAVGDVAEGTGLPVEIMGLNLAIFHIAGGGLYCIDNVCTHAFALLTDGWLEGTLIECPLHAGQFDVCTGKGQGAPIEADVQTYAIKVVGGDILVALPG